MVPYALQVSLTACMVIQQPLAGYVLSDIIYQETPAYHVIVPAISAGQQPHNVLPVTLAIILHRCIIAAPVAPIAASVPSPHVIFVTVVTISLLVYVSCVRYPIVTSALLQAKPV